MKLYIWLDRLIRGLRSRLYLLDFRLRGGLAAPGVRLAGFIRTTDASRIRLGRRVRVGRQVKIQCRSSRVEIGDDTAIGDNVRIDAITGDVRIGDNVLINNSTVITAWSGVAIGDDTRIAPFCHITDRNHGIARDRLIREQDGESSPIHIGRDVWIASSCIVLQGVLVGDGAVIGANSVVNADVDHEAIVVGSPARVIGHRRGAEDGVCV